MSRAMALNQPASLATNLLLFVQYIAHLGNAALTVPVLACTFFIISEKLEILSELVNPINVTTLTFIMKHRPVAPG